MRRLRVGVGCQRKPKPGLAKKVSGGSVLGLAAVFQTVPPSIKGASWKVGFPSVFRTTGKRPSTDALNPLSPERAFCRYPRTDCPPPITNWWGGKRESPESWRLLWAMSRLPLPKSWRRSICPCQLKKRLSGIGSSLTVASNRPVPMLN
jgi:hypothetical protein